MDAHAGLMRLAQAQFKMFDSLDMIGSDMDDDIDDAMEDDIDSEVDVEVDGACGTGKGGVTSKTVNVNDKALDLFDNDSIASYSASAGVGGAAHTSHRSFKRSMPELTEPPTPRKLRSAKGDVVQNVVQPQPYTLENMNAAVEADVPAIFDIVGITNMKDMIVEKLEKKHYTILVRVTRRHSSTY